MKRKRSKVDRALDAFVQAAQQANRALKRHAQNAKPSRRYPKGALQAIREGDAAGLRLAERLGYLDFKKGDGLDHLRERPAREWR